MPKGVWIGLIVVAAWFACVFAFDRFHGTSPSAVATASAATVPSGPDPARVAQCKEIEQSAPRGAVQEYSVSDKIGSVVVGPAFYAAPFRDKEALNSIMHCILSDGRKEDSGVSSIIYSDKYTNKTVATWSRGTGFAME